MDLSLFFEKYLLPKGVRLPRSKGNVAPSLFSSVAAATGGSFGPRKLHSKLPQISHFSYEDFLPLAARFPTMVCIAGINVGLGSLRRKEQLTGFCPHSTKNRVRIAPVCLITRSHLRIGYKGLGAICSPVLTSCHTMTEGFEIVTVENSLLV